MIGFPRFAAALSMLVGVSAAIAPPAQAERDWRSWMSEDAMRAAFIGKTLDGYYAVLMRDGTGIADIRQALLMVVLFGIGFAAIGAWRFKFER